jgi:5'-3' exonuclease
MGIVKLHSFIRDKCKEGIEKIEIKILKGKTVAVDVSQFMYRFKKNKRLILDMFSICSLFRKHDINVIFVFDGIPPEEKQDAILDRKTKRHDNLDKYNHLKMFIDEGIIPANQTILNKLKQLYDNTIHITKKEYDDVRSLFDAYGMRYIVATGEADNLCAYMCKNDIVYAVISDDTDMFALGCPRIIRYLSLLYETIHLYHINKIYKTLDVSESQFRWLCAVSINDYNYKNNSTNQSTTSKSFGQNYISNLHKKVENRDTDLIKLYDVSHLETNNIPMIVNKHYDKKQLSSFLERYNIFEV